MGFNIFYRLVLVWDIKPPKYGVIKYKHFLVNMRTFIGLLILMLTKCIFKQL